MTFTLGYAEVFALGVFAGVVATLLILFVIGATMGGRKK